MRIILLGAGRSGLGAARLLAQDKKIILINEKAFPEQEELEALGVTVLIQDFESFDFKCDDLIYKAPGIAESAFFPKTYNEIDLVAEYAPQYDLYAVSGTNGKTTTTTLLNAMLNRQFPSFAAGNIGYSLSQSIVDHGDMAAKVALEISAFQMDGVKNARFEIYALMNLTPDHLDRYGNEKAYYNAKMKIFPYTKQLILNYDDANIMSEISQKTLPEKCYYLSLKERKDIYLENDAIYFHETKLFNLADLHLIGTHNLYNAAFAATMAYLAGVEVKEIQKVLQNFSGVPHRMEYVDTIEGVAFYNDSKGTNPEATQVCLQSFDNIHWLAGGYDEGNDFATLIKEKAHIKKAYFYGASAQKLQKHFPEAKIYPDLKAAFKAAVSQAEALDNIVLSPACASYDQYDNFEQRGEEFKKLVKTL
ncbi:MAG TPA: UDP-N-acetylmuramoyl-L-alanine--D-glutamate ligase [Erysipelothrix sp.]